MEWTDFVIRIAPVTVAAYVPHGVVLGPLVAQAIVDAESRGERDGPWKKTYVLEVVTDGVIALNAARGVEMFDPSAVYVAVGQAIDDTIAFVNLLDNRPGASLRQLGKVGGDA